MGCFGYICKNCGEPVNYKEGVKLFLLQRGKVLEEMEGDYNHYGSVDDQEWEADWGDVCMLQFGQERSSGIAAIHTDCWNGVIPKERSDDDPKQAAGKPKHKKAKSTSHFVYQEIDTTPTEADIQQHKELIQLNGKITDLIADAQKLIDEITKIEENERTK